MTSPSLEDTLKTLSYHQALVLYWTCEGLSNENIAARYGYTKAWVVWQMSFVYHKLGLDRKDQKTGKKPHWTERRAFLREKVCPVLRRLINDDLENLEIFPIIPPNVYEGEIINIPSETAEVETPLSETTTSPLEPVIPVDSPPPEIPDKIPPINGEPPPPPPDFYPIELYNAWLMVLEDDRRVDPPLPPPPKRPILWRRILGLGFIVLLGCVAVGALAFWIGQRGTLPESAASEPLLVATFDQGLPDGMELIYGDIDFVNGELVAHDFSLLAIGDDTWKNYQIEYDAKKHTYCFGLENNGISAHAINAENMIMWSWNYCESGWYRFIGGNWELIQFEDPNIADPGTMNTIKLVAKDGNFEAYVNNRKISSFLDQNYTQGKAYIYVSETSVIDNVRVSQLP